MIHLMTFKKISYSLLSDQGAPYLKVVKNPIKAKINYYLEIKVCDATHEMLFRIEKSIILG
jgi:hypothetical protein